MRWESGRRSTNIEDRRGIGGAGMIGGGGIGMLILVLIISFITGQNPLELLQQMPQTRRRRTAGRAAAGRRSAGADGLGGPRPTPKTPGRQIFARERLDATRSRCWCCSKGRCGRPAASPRQPSGRSTVRAITSSTSTSRSSASWINASARQATSLRPTSSPTRSAITSRRCSGLRAASTRCGRARPKPRATRSPCARNCRPTATPASGAITPPGATGSMRGRRRRAARGRRDRRRPASEAVAGLRGAGELHARLVRAAAAVAAPRPADRRHPPVRHVRCVPLAEPDSVSLTRSLFAPPGQGTSCRLP